MGDGWPPPTGDVVEVDMRPVRVWWDPRDGSKRSQIRGMDRRRDHLAPSASGDIVASGLADHLYQNKLLSAEHVKVADDESWPWDLTGDFVEVRPNRLCSWHWLFLSPTRFYLALSAHDQHLSDGWPPPPVMVSRWT